ncbi:calcium:proton antiporter [Chitinilyticum piscinae]|uniref:Ionic transporter y4hA n=1 Tax=Chitinilyticum piscinae TaxID=2866724 RepID=A0A8J7KGR7_9NEIS|nr:ionic transporter y4hA [Chitinilyticum piscinae]MBE9610629.1 ionic transporter y4hA [Chitinilyticum piscinae]
MLARMPHWTTTLPLLGSALLLLAGQMPAHGLTILLLSLALAGTVFAAVHHAEVVAHRVGEPLGTLVLALAVTIIEVALIISMMMGGGAEKATLARDTVFSAIMIVCNGIVGLCLLLGGLRHRIQGFQLHGANAALGVLIPLAVVALILPNYLLSQPGPAIGGSQLAFLGVVGLLFYVAFVFVQTIRHRDYFLVPGSHDEEEHALPPDNRTALASLVLLLVALVAVVGLAKLLSPAIEGAVAAVGAPAAVVGIVIAALVLLPEGLAAARAARADRLQTSLNLALGSVLATIGLTIPVLAAVHVYLGAPLIVGLPVRDSILLVLTLFVSTLTLATGRTTLLQGMVHLLLFAVFLFVSVVP